MRASLIFVFLVVALSGCSTFTAPRYSLTADTNVALKAVGASGVAVGAITGPANFDSACRGAGPISLPDGNSPAAYLKRALEDELKVAGAYAASEPRVTISGTITKLEFGSMRGITGGTWDVALRLSSTNGRSMTTTSRYEFESGYAGDTACKTTAEAFMPAVQDLITKIVKSPEFRAMVQ